MREIEFMYRGKRHYADVEEVNIRTRVVYKISIYQGPNFTMGQSNREGMNNWDCSDPKIGKELLKAIGLVLLGGE